MQSMLAWRSNAMCAGDHNHHLITFSFIYKTLATKKLVLPLGAKCLSRPTAPCWKSTKIRLEDRSMLEENLNLGFQNGNEKWKENDSRMADKSSLLFCSISYLSTSLGWWFPSSSFRFCYPTFKPIRDKIWRAVYTQGYSWSVKETRHNEHRFWENMEWSRKGIYVDTKERSFYLKKTPNRPKFIFSIRLIEVPRFRNGASSARLKVVRQVCRTWVHRGSFTNKKKNQTIEKLILTKNLPFKSLGTWLMMTVTYRKQVSKYLDIAAARG